MDTNGLILIPAVVYFLPSGLILILAVVYFIPSIVAAVRNHRELGAIFRWNIFLGWTIVGWISALIWAMEK
jgi:hypothetical protein